MTHAERLIALIAGHQPAGLPSSDVVNPATGAAFATFAFATAAHVDEVLASAAAAARIAAATPLADRRALLEKLAVIIEAESEALAELLTLEQGKPIAQARGEVTGAAGLMRYYATIHPDRTEALFDEDNSTHRRIYKPLGVVAGIVPWNFPFLIAAMKIAPAILTGNAIVIKPSPTTPLTALALAALAADIIPEGLVQVIGDDGSVGPLLTNHPGVAKIVFTGSTATGRAVMGSAAAHLTRVTLELGGNDAAIVLADAGVASTAAGIFKAAFTNAGQICGAIKRVYVHDSLFNAFAEELAGHVASAVVGSGMDEAVTLGPVQNDRQHERALALRGLALRDGRLIAEAPVPDGAGFYVPPSLFADLDDSHPLVAEEQFAPLLPLVRFHDEEDALRRANGTPFALTASVWSGDVAHGEAVAARLEAALICVNTHNQCPAGVGLSMSKQSGIGWLLGDEGLKEYLMSYALVRAA